MRRPRRPSDRRGPLRRRPHHAGVLRQHARCTRAVGAVHAAFRRASSASSRSTHTRRPSASIVTASPSRSSAIGPPTHASGATWPTTSPCVPPENRPSVISPTLSPSPWPTSAAVTASISRMPGPPTGPSPRMTTTSPALDLPRLRWPRSTPPRRRTPCAGPVIFRCFSPATLATAPSGRQVAVQDDDVPARVHRLLERLDHALLPRVDARHVLQVLRQRLARARSCSRRASSPRSSSALSTAGVPPTLCRSYITYWPPGLRSARCGTLSPDAVEVGQRPLHLRLAGDRHQVQHRVGRAAQGQHERVGVLQRLARDDVARPDVLARSAAPAPRRPGTPRAPWRPRRPGCWRRTAATGPSPRWPQLMVLAVYMPPHEPGPGHASHSTLWTPLSSSLPAWYWPTASKIETMSMSSPSAPTPGRMLPP